mmetsp:Transcript_18202/g.41934  ORF Transcript_18202/g.41934 Transcript_18202/m.41934 type:complete len:180 (+) Transcript_18202:91-630(+)
MLSNLAFTSPNHRTVEPSLSQELGSKKKGLETKQQSSTDIVSPAVSNDLRHRPAPKRDIILRVSNRQNSKLQLRPELEIPSTCKEVNLMYDNHRDYEGTLSVLSDGDAFLIDSQVECNENKNSGPSFMFASMNIQQRQHYIGGNYFFRQNTNTAESDCRDAVLYNSFNQCKNKEPSSVL